jgi:hypothetical protein
VETVEVGVLLSPLEELVCNSLAEISTLVEVLAV